MSRTLCELLCALALLAHLSGCTASQRKAGRTALEAVEAGCTVVEAIPVDGALESACLATEELRDAATEVLKKRKKHKAPPASSSSAPPPAASAPPPEVGSP